MVSSREARQRASARRWLAVVIGTVIMWLSYVPLILVPMLLEDEPNPEDLGAAIGFALAVIPLVFIAVAYISRHRRPVLASVGGVGLFVVVFLPLGLVPPVQVALSTAFAAGGAIALRVDHGLEAQWARVMAVGLMMLVLFALAYLSPPLGIAAGGLLPLLVLGLADQWVASRYPLGGELDKRLLDE